MIWEVGLLDFTPFIPYSSINLHAFKTAMEEFFFTALVMLALVVGCSNDKEQQCQVFSAGLILDQVCFGLQGNVHFVFSASSRGL